METKQQNLDSFDENQSLQVIKRNDSGFSKETKKRWCSIYLMGMDYFL